MLKKAWIAVAVFFLTGGLIAAAFWAAGDRDLVGPGEKLERRDGKVIVPDERVPDDFPGLLAGPAIVLLPNHVRSEPVEGDVSEDDVEEILSTWETIFPSKTYEKRVIPISAPEAEDSLVSRTDSVDPPGACGREGCNTLRWVPGSFGNMKIEMYDGERAHVTGQGVVVYEGVAGFDARDGVSYLRYYGLILRKQDGRWLLERAAAETGEPVG